MGDALAQAAPCHKMPARPGAGRGELFWPGMEPAAAFARLAVSLTDEGIMRRAYPILHILLIAAMLLAAVAMANGGAVQSGSFPVAALPATL